MEIIKVTSDVEGGKVAFGIIENGMKKGNIKVLGLATGSTPETLYNEMRASDTDFSDMISINLDEYVSLSGDDPQSYSHFMDQHLFKAKPFKDTHVPNGQAEDLAAECQAYEMLIQEHPIDIQILGIGENGHIGFNEPGTSFDATTHVVSLTDSTINANKRFFERIEDVPTQAISIGIGTILKAKKIVLIAFGESKADAVKAMVDGELSETLPASILQKHPDVVVIVDEAAGSKL